MRKLYLFEKGVGWALNRPAKNPNSKFSMKSFDLFWKCGGGVIKTKSEV